MLDIFKIWISTFSNSAGCQKLLSFSVINQRIIMVMSFRVGDIFIVGRKYKANINHSVVLQFATWLVYARRGELDPKGKLFLCKLRIRK